MKVVILAGGMGTRMREETQYIPKPMVEIGGKPILWYIMKHYAYYGHKEFIICLGYKGQVIRDYFRNFHITNYDCTLDLSGGWTLLESNNEADWKVTLVDTGLETQTGGRLRRINKYIKDSPFFCTYGDGVSNVDLNKLLATHETYTKQYGMLATITVVNSTSKFGNISMDEFVVRDFHEKSAINKINGGFFVFEPEVLDSIEGDHDPLETGLLTKLTESRRLIAYYHEDVWACADTMKDVIELNKLCENGQPPWQVW